MIKVSQSRCVLNQEGAQGSLIYALIFVLSIITGCSHQEQIEEIMGQDIGQSYQNRDQSLDQDPDSSMTINEDMGQNSNQEELDQASPSNPDQSELDLGVLDEGTIEPPLAELYAPSSGPLAGTGNLVIVDSTSVLLESINNAVPGDEITIAPGVYSLNQLIRVNRDGAEDARIFLRAEEPGTVTLELSHIENFKFYAKYWVVENLRFVGVCDDGQGCEHAFHIVGDADDLIFRNNEVVDFASHIKINGEKLGGHQAQSFPDRTMFIDNFWHNTRYISNNAPHNILNIDGGKDHVVRGNIFADFNTPSSLPKSASAIYPKASTLRILIEQNLIVCEKSRIEGETARGIQLGDGAPASICDGDPDQDGIGDCEERGQSQEAIVRNNIIMNCNNKGSATGIMVGSDRESQIIHNTVYHVDRRNGGFYQGHPNHDTFWRANILENGINLDYANRPLSSIQDFTPSLSEMNAIFTNPHAGHFELLRSDDIVDQVDTDPIALHDFCGYPRGTRADLGAIEYSTSYEGVTCAAIVQRLYDRIP